METNPQEPLILTVSQLTQAIKLHLEKRFPSVWIKGEISNLKLQTSGHLYFSLKDEGAQISCAMFRQDLSKLVIMPKDGDQVIVRGELNVWPPRGAYQLVIRELSQVGLGDAMIRFEMLKKKLDKLGWFDPKIKKPLPHFPKTIGVVTSPTGAVIQDILNILSRRAKSFHLLLCPVKVQGDGAVQEIVQGINLFNQHSLCDVMIVGRGGGSFEDLAAFNSEEVARAIHESTIPIISAVGHETDVSIADFVADIRAPTPSAAAEIVSHEQDAIVKKLDGYRTSIANSLRHTLKIKREQLRQILRLPLLTSPDRFLGLYFQNLDSVREEIDFSMKAKIAVIKKDLHHKKNLLEIIKPSQRIQDRKNALQKLGRQLELVLMRFLKQKAAKCELISKQKLLDQRLLSDIRLKKQALHNIQSRLEALHPKNLLNRGYSILFSQKDGSPITTVRAVAVDEAVEIHLKDGKIEARITKIVSVN